MTEVLPPVVVDFDALDSTPYEEDSWKSRLMSENPKDWNFAEAGPSEPAFELPDEPAPGQAQEDPAVEQASKGLFDWVGGALGLGSSAEPEKPAKDKGKEKVAPKKAPVKKQPPKVAAEKGPARRTPIQKPKARALPKTEARKAPARRKPGTIADDDPEKDEKTRLMIKYQMWAKRFGAEQDVMTKNMKQLAALPMDQMEREYLLLKAKTNEGVNEAMVYDMFEHGLKYLGDFYGKYLRRQRLASMLYGNVEFVYLGEVIDDALGEETGDPDLKLALAEAAIELAEWLQMEWYYRLCWHAHKLCKEAADLEVKAKTAQLAKGQVSDGGERILSGLGLQ